MGGIDIAFVSARRLATGNKLLTHLHRLVKIPGAECTEENDVKGR